MGVSASVNQYMKKSYDFAIAVMTRPRPAKQSPMRKASGTMRTMVHDCASPSAVATSNTATPDMKLFDAAQIHSANTTSSRLTGALRIPSHVRCTCMRANPEYRASKEAESIVE
jgi:hypothetical protein